MMKRFHIWATSLEGKFILAAAACIIVVCISAGLFFVRREEQLHHSDAFHKGYALSEMGRLLLTNVMVFQELGIMNRQDLVDYLDYFIQNFKERNNDVLSVAVLDSHGAVLAHCDISEHGGCCTDEFLKKAFAQLTTDISEVTYQGKNALMITAPLNIDSKNWGALRIVLSLEEMHVEIGKLKREIFLISVCFLALALTVLKIGARKLSRPILKLTQTMDSIRDHGDLQVQPALVRRSDELGKLQNSFIWFLQRLAESDRERSKAIEQLAQNEKLVSIGYLASGVAHEINNPLGGITICFKSLAGFTTKTPDSVKLTMAIEDGLKKIKGIVEQLLDFSRVSKTEQKPVDLNSLICRLLVLFQYEAQRREIMVELELDEEIPCCVADENKMSQVFMNLITNALQAMGNGGTLRISTALEGDCCRIAFSDTGQGIAPENIPYIFDPFFSTKKVGEGTGLGLSVSRGIIEQHQGALKVESEPRLGTTFTIHLPLECSLSKGTST
jgi:signal transduction histidine kinase